MAANKRTIEIVRTTLSYDPQISPTKAKRILDELTFEEQYEPCSEGEAADILQISKSTLQRWRKGEGKYADLEFTLKTAPKPFGKEGEFVYNKIQVLKLRDKLFQGLLGGTDIQIERLSLHENTPNS